MFFNIGNNICPENYPYAFGNYSTRPAGREYCCDVLPLEPTNGNDVCSGDEIPCPSYPTPCVDANGKSI